jgi:hypothetical protein
MSSNNPNLPKNGPFEVREFEGGKLRKITIFELEGDTLFTIDNTKGVKFTKSSDASKYKDTLTFDLV